MPKVSTMRLLSYSIIRPILTGTFCPSSAKLYSLIKCQKDRGMYVVYKWNKFKHMGPKCSKWSMDLKNTGQHARVSNYYAIPRYLFKVFDTSIIYVPRSNYPVDQHGIPSLSTSLSKICLTRPGTVCVREQQYYFSAIKFHYTHWTK